MNDVRELLEKAKEDKEKWNFMLARVLVLTGHKDEIEKLKKF